MDTRPDDDRAVMLAAFAAMGDVRGAQRVIKADPGAVNEPGIDGTTPLCAAALWGHMDVLRLLLDSKASPGARNESGPGWTALHAAALQENGKACMLLLEHRANPQAKDSAGISACDYASCSEAVWPLFAAQGCTRVDKAVLVEKGVLRRASPELEKQLQAEADAADRGNQRRGIIDKYSRPGSAYVVSHEFPPRPGSSAVALRRDSSTARPGTGRKMSLPIDILEEDPSLEGAGRGLGSLGL
mmetsp:Transcript_45911/g.106735  ORF Transcript_45911/g.106735 Transcript_45911/m.106735 type:complete len:243 (+) Transcript_45911:87-815(+)